MDQRQTFKDSDELLSFVSQIFQQKQQASLLIDKDGLTRVEGTITAINEHNNVNETSIVVNDTIPFAIKEIIGINGIFRSDYSEC